MSNCSNHKKDLFGESDMKKVAEAIGDLHYETLGSLLFSLSEKLNQDSASDYFGERHQLAKALQSAAFRTQGAASKIYEAWHISKPFMEDKK